eukprot:610620-Pleurochrysis_carterae.AAC.1
MLTESSTLRVAGESFAPIVYRFIWQPCGRGSVARGRYKNSLVNPVPRVCERDSGLREARLRSVRRAVLQQKVGAHLGVDEPEEHDGRGERQQAHNGLCVSFATAATVAVGAAEPAGASARV